MLALKHIFRNKTATVDGNNFVHCDSHMVCLDGSSYRCVPKLYCISETNCLWVAWIM